MRMKSKQTKDLSNQESLIIDLATKWCIKALDDVSLSVKRVNYDESNERETDGWQSAWDRSARSEFEDLERQWGLKIDINKEMDFSSLWLTFDAKLTTEQGEVGLTLNFRNHSGDFEMTVNGGSLSNGYLEIDI